MAATGLLAPGAFWDGTTTWTTGGRTPPSDPLPRTAPKPICFFNDVPYQSTSSNFTVGVAAFAKGGITKVTFWLEGNTFDVTDWSVNPQTGKHEYCCTINTVATSFNGEAHLYATVVPADGSFQSRVLGPWPIYLNKTGGLTSPVYYVGGSGASDATATPTSPATPYATLGACLNYIAANASRHGTAGTTVKCRAGTYTLLANGTGSSLLNLKPWLTITCDDGLSRSDVTLVLGSWQLRGERMRLKSVTIQMTVANDIEIWASLTYRELWLDDCNCYSDIAYDGVATTWADWAVGVLKRYATGTDFRDLPARGVRNFDLARSVTSIRTRIDGIRDCKAVYGATVSLLHDPADNHPDGIQIATSGENFAYINCLFPGITGQIFFIEVASVLDIAIVNLLGIQTTNDQYLTQFDGTGANVYDHALFWHLTIPNARVLLTVDAVWTNSDYRGCMQSDLGGPATGMVFAAGHSCLVGTTDAAAYGFTTGNPGFVDGGYNANYDAAHANYSPAAASALLARVSRVVPFDLAGHARAATTAVGSYSYATEFTAPSSSSSPAPAFLLMGPL